MLENHQISSQLIDLIIHNTNMHAILKDAKSGKCIDINSSHLAVYGFNNPNSVIGCTVWDMNTKMDKMWLDNALQVAKFDEEVIYTNKPIIKPKRVWLNANGHVWLHSMSKIPVINTQNKVIAILGSSSDLTNNLQIDELYQYYCNFYQDQNIRVSKFLEHTKILSLFNEIPSHAETIVLINKILLVNNKKIADKLNIRLSTIESHINKLNQKINQFQLVFNILRSW